MDVYPHQFSLMGLPVKLSSFFDSKVKKSTAFTNKTTTTNPKTSVKDPERKQIKIRTKEHVHGNWPTIIFIPSTTPMITLELIQNTLKLF